MKLRKKASKFFDFPAKCVIGRKAVMYLLNMYLFSNLSNFNGLKIITSYLTYDTKNADTALCHCTTLNKYIGSAQSAVTTILVSSS